MFNFGYYIIGNNIEALEVAGLYFAISFFILVLDLFTKHIVKNMVPHQSIPVIKNVFHITYVQNTGAAFSILKGKTFLFTVVSSIVIVIITLVLIKLPAKHKAFGIVMALILGGAMGNFIDRLRFGYVVDFRL